MREILKKLGEGGLETKMYYSVQRDEVYCKIRASLGRLKNEADRIDYKLLLERETLRKSAEKGLPEKGIGPIDIRDVKAASSRDPFSTIYGPYDTGREFQHLYKKYGKNKVPYPHRAASGPAL